MSRIVASAVDFFVGITADGDELVLGVGLGLVLVAAGDEDLLGDGDASAFLGAGEAVFSVVTDTLGSSDFSGAVASGEAAGEALSSWATATGAAAAKRAVRARIVSFMMDLLLKRAAGKSVDPAPVSLEARIVWSGPILRQGRITAQDPWP
jgi:hypothetical protein